MFAPDRTPENPQPITGLRDWLDHRTGYRNLISALLIEHIPGGAKWRYVWGSCLAMVFLVQLITGLLLMTAYSPGDSTAWASVYFIQYQMDFGWLIRGVHHFGSQAMIVLLGVHMLQVVIAGAHLPPREINWWLGLLLMILVLGLGLTGYLLPWDQKGYWATQVATNIAGNLPGAGAFVQRIAVGGPEYGHHTLTRFYALHTTILPGLVILLLIAHVALFRRHGVTHPKSPVGEGMFWPDQAFRDMLVSLLVFAIILGLAVYGFGHKVDTPPSENTGVYDRLAHAGRDGRGANLDAPADPSRPYPARPEWYFLFLFQLLKYFKGDQELIGTVVIPNAVLVLLFILPLLGYGRLRRFGHAVAVIVVVGLLGAVGLLTYWAITDDYDPHPQITKEELEKLPAHRREQIEKTKKFQQEMRDADSLAHRAIQLAPEGIPAEGPVFLLRRDPLTQGPKLFQQHCAVCHQHGDDFTDEVGHTQYTASDLKNFGTAQWIRGLLSDPSDPRYFGRTNLTTMANWVKRTKANEARKGKDKELAAQFDLIADWLATHPDKEEPAEHDHSSFAQGYRAFAERCSECHSYKGSLTGGTPGPDLTGYGSADWLRLMIMAPASDRRYGINNTMPALRDLEGVAGGLAELDQRQRMQQLLQASPDNEEQVKTACKLQPLSDIDRELIIRWLLGDNRVLFGGEPIADPPQR
jgi:ubiquinol-cytochrome c reductase cytochrome b subunit